MCVGFLPQHSNSVGGMPFQVPPATHLGHVGNQLNRSDLLVQVHQSPYTGFVQILESPGI